MNSTIQVTNYKVPFAENHNSNGITQKINWVVRGTPFWLVLADSTGDESEKRWGVSCRLVTSKDGQVPSITEEPLSYVLHANTPSGSSTLECRIHVLSSQLNNSYFKVQITLSDLQAGTEATLTTELFKSVSKPAQIRRRREQIENPGAIRKGTKRARSEDVLAALDDIKATQLKHTQLFEKLLANPSVSTALTQQSDTQAPLIFPTASPFDPKTGSSIFTLVGGKSLPALKSVTLAHNPVGSVPDFDFALQNFLAAWRALPVTQRPFKMRRVVSESRDEVRSFVRTVQSELMSYDNESLCSCLDCPHKRELEQLDGFYSEILK